MRRAGLALLAFLAASGAALGEDAGHGSTPPEPEVAGHETPAPAQDEAHESEFAPTRSPMPFDVIRSVQFLQDQVARGNGRAIRVQAMLLRRFARSFLEADPAVWQDPRNFRAAILFTLSGGPPEMLDRLSKEGLLEADQQSLTDGALAYVRNDFETARKAFQGVDLMKLEPGLGAQLALVRGQMDQTDHPEEAARYLDIARLLAPGTLVEEAALRLEVMVVEALGQHDRADRMARRYFERYGESTYAANFEARLAAVYSGRESPAAENVVADLDDVLGPLPEPRQQRLFLAVGRRALSEGNLPVAHLAAERALQFENLADADRQRATLYAAASILGKTDPEASRAALVAIDRDALHPEDVKILDAALSVLDGIEKGPPKVTVADLSPSEDDLPILGRASQALASASQDIDTP